MRWIIALAGVVCAIFAGTYAGGLVKPEVGSLVGQISAPRLETIAAGRRVDTPVENVEPTALGEDVPDYVVGTDWLPPPFDEDAMQAEETEVDPVAVVSAAGPAPVKKPKALQALAAGKVVEPLKKAPAAAALVADTAPVNAPLF